MDWIKLAFVLAGVVFWIISNLREAKKPTAPAPPPLPGGDGDAASAAKRPEDLQDFLNQIRRRMGETESRPLELDVVPPEPRRLPPPVPILPIKKQRQADKAPNLSKRTAEVTSLVAEPMTFEAMKAEIKPMAGIMRVTSQAAKNAVKVMKSPGGMATAFVLREILDVPLSKRRRGR